MSCSSVGRCVGGGGGGNEWSGDVMGMRGQERSHQEEGYGGIGQRKVSIKVLGVSSFPRSRSFPLVVEIEELGEDELVTAGAGGMPT